jgi:hypothetical protein
MSNASLTALSWELHRFASEDDVVFVTLGFSLAGTSG